MTTNVLGSGDKREILRRAKKGESLSALAKEFGVTTQAISYHTRSALGPRSVKKVTASMVKQMTRAWDKGETAREIARRFGLAETTVAKYMRETGRKGRLNRKPNFFPPEDPVDIAYLAATLDAEDCIHRSEAHCVHWQVSITGSSPALMDWLSQWGGSVYEAPLQTRTGTRKGVRKQVYVWMLTAAWDIATMLDVVLPFMIEKQAKAVVTVEEIIARFGSPPWAPETRPAIDPPPDFSRKN